MSIYYEPRKHFTIGNLRGNFQWFFNLNILTQESIVVQSKLGHIFKTRFSLFSNTYLYWLFDGNYHALYIRKMKKQTKWKWGGGRECSRKEKWQVKGLELGHMLSKFQERCGGHSWGQKCSKKIKDIGHCKESGFCSKGEGKNWSIMS